MIGHCITTLRAQLVIGVLCASMSAAAAPAAGKGDSLARRLNVAEQQEMLGERLARTWAMRAHGSLNGRANNQFDEDSRRFARQLKQLQNDADTPELKDNYVQLEQSWAKFLDLANNGASGSNVQQMAEQSDELVRIAEKGATMLSQRLGAEPSEGMRLAGDARTLSQRLAKLYFFRSLGSSAPFIANDMKKAEANYLASIKRLRELAESKPKAAANMALVDQQWAFFSEVIHRPPNRDDRDTYYQTLAKSSDSLLGALEDLSQSFE